MADLRDGPARSLSPDLSTRRGPPLGPLPLTCGGTPGSAFVSPPPFRPIGRENACGSDRHLKGRDRRRGLGAVERVLGRSRAPAQRTLQPRARMIRLQLRQVVGPMNPVRFRAFSWSGGRGERRSRVEPRRTRARTRARACRHRKNRRGDCHSPKVAVEIAKRTGREIGIKATDRYERDSRPAPRLRHVHEAALRATPIVAYSHRPGTRQGKRGEPAECGAHVRNAVVSRTPTRRSRAPATRSAASQRSWLPRPRNRPS